MDNRTLVPKKGRCYNMENGRKRGGASMHLLSDEALLDAYVKATHLGLEQEFIALLMEEINKRDLHVPPH
ncbi:Sporulation inhibitor A [compost metagenome]